MEQCDVFGAQADTTIGMPEAARVQRPHDRRYVQYNNISFDLMHTFACTVFCPAFWWPHATTRAIWHRTVAVATISLATRAVGMARSCNGMTMKMPYFTLLQ
jgi:hypothetical protein